MGAEAEGEKPNKNGTDNGGLLARRKGLPEGEYWPGMRLEREKKKSCAKGKKVSWIPVNRENELEKDMKRWPECNPERNVQEISVCENQGEWNCIFFTRMWWKGDESV